MDSSGRSTRLLEIALIIVLVLNFFEHAWIFRDTQVNCAGAPMFSGRNELSFALPNDLCNSSVLKNESSSIGMDQGSASIVHTSYIVVSRKTVETYIHSQNRLQNEVDQLRKELSFKDAKIKLSTDKASRVLDLYLSQVNSSTRLLGILLVRGGHPRNGVMNMYPDPSPTQTRALQTFSNTQVQLMQRARGWRFGDVVMVVCISQIPFFGLLMTTMSRGSSCSIPAKKSPCAKPKRSEFEQLFKEALDRATYRTGGGTQASSSKHDCHSPADPAQTQPGSTSTQPEQEHAQASSDGPSQTDPGHSDDKDAQDEEFSIIDRCPNIQRSREHPRGTSSDGNGSTTSSADTNTNADTSGARFIRRCLELVNKAIQLDDSDDAEEYATDIHPIIISSGYYYMAMSHMLPSIVVRVLLQMRELALVIDNCCKALQLIEAAGKMPKTPEDIESEGFLVRPYEILKLKFKANSELGLSEEATACLEHIDSIYPESRTDLSFLMLKADTLVNLDRFEQAVEAIEALERLSDKPPTEALELKAESLLHLGPRYLEATVNTYKILAEREPNGAHSLHAAVRSAADYLGRFIAVNVDSSTLLHPVHSKHFKNFNLTFRALIKAKKMLELENVDILQSNLDESLKLITTRYRKISLKCHPDKNTEDKELHTARFRAVNDSYEYLKKIIQDQVKCDQKLASMASRQGH
ncbi:uncharacterized protein BJ171DRAFT_626890 [Polychytrium aggregatum]|uniref:uncharacterized protein n=1 Tax=Polychytrium aggregatum TaxID=110093 RepID=UPI0022FDC264|nr:uncharacterized protein BJ171DRAFT_626890 [Polychytrium aggregatum]KAI9208895.1 hypothetical protein BJ171DRAFT_626890 [Polychytrium aggregatum]